MKGLMINAAERINIIKAWRAGSAEPEQSDPYLLEKALRILQAHEASNPFIKLEELRSILNFPHEIEIQATSVNIYPSYSQVSVEDSGVVAEQRPAA